MSWWKKSTVYEIYPLSFKDTTGTGMGDINGIIEKLDYLQNLGVDVLWITPIYESPLKDNGYDISDYYKINERFGTMEDFERLLSEAHSRNIKIIMDLVVNHCSDQHKWFQEAIKDKNSKYRDYFLFSDKKETDEIGIFSEPAWEYHEKADAYYYHLFAKEQPDLNWDNPDMREEIYTMINWWLDKGIDGFRLDVIDLIGKIPLEGRIDLNKSHKYIHEIYKKCFDGRDVFTVGETPNATPEEAIKYSGVGSEQLSMVFGFEHIAVDEQNYTKWDVKKLNLLELKAILDKWQIGLSEDGWNSLFWSNHDQPRTVSRFGNDTKYRVESAKMLGTLLHCMKGTPYVYQGEEFGMTNCKFERSELRDVETFNMIEEKRNKGWSEDKIQEGIDVKGRDNARTPFQWDKTQNAGFTTGTPWLKTNPNYKEINAENALADRNSIFYTYKNLINLRKTYDVFVEGDYKPILKDNDKVYAYTRSLGNEKLTVICSFSDEETSVDVDLDYNEVFEHNYKEINYDGKRLLLKPYEAIAVYKK